MSQRKTRLPHLSQPAAGSGSESQSVRACSSASSATAVSAQMMASRSASAYESGIQASCRRVPLCSRIAVLSVGESDSVGPSMATPSAVSFFPLFRERTRILQLLPFCEIVNGLCIHTLASRTYSLCKSNFTMKNTIDIIVSSLLEGNVI